MTIVDITAVLREKTWERDFALMARSMERMRDVMDILAQAAPGDQCKYEALVESYKGLYAALDDFVTTLHEDEVLQ